MAVPITVSPEATYATKVNIEFPGSAAQATAAEAQAEDDINDRLPANVSVTVDAGAIVVAT